MFETNLEIEARASLTFYEFEKLLHLLHSSHVMTFLGSNKSLDNYYTNGTRQENTETSVKSVYKQTKLSKDFSQFKIVRSTEKPSVCSGNLILSRNKTRHTFLYKFWRYDLTEVISNGLTKYELEIEIVNYIEARSKTRKYLYDSLVGKITELLQVVNRELDHV